jgi:flagellar biosynthesis protein FliQ
LRSASRSKPAINNFFAERGIYAASTSLEICALKRAEARAPQTAMNPEFAIDVLKSMILQSLTLAAPILLTAMVIGLAVSLFQAVTTIHEQTLAFVPKALAVVGICLLLLPWIVRSLIDFTTAVFLKMPQMVN